MVSDAEQPFASVTVTMYVVVTVGLAVGLAAVDELNPVDGLHTYVYGLVPPVAVGDPPIVVLVPLQIVLSEPASATGRACNVTVTVSDAEQPFASVTVTMYVVVEVGLAVGLAAVDELNPVDGLHAYVYGLVPPVAVGLPPIATLPPLQTCASGPASTVGCG